jgi:hypothetical protein
MQDKEIQVTPLEWRTGSPGLQRRPRPYDSAEHGWGRSRVLNQVGQNRLLVIARKAVGATQAAIFCLQKRC